MHHRPGRRGADGEFAYLRMNRLLKRDGLTRGSRSTIGICDGRGKRVRPQGVVLGCPGERRCRPADGRGSDLGSIHRTGEGI